MALFDKCSARARQVDMMKSTGQFFYLREFEPTTTPVVRMNDREYIMLGSNNYLGLADHPRVVEAAINALREHGTGACSSRVLTGTSVLHNRLERALAEYKGAEDAVLFSTGFMTMMGTISALTDSEDVIISDEFNHASIVDGCRLSRAQKKVYRHNDMASLEEQLALSMDAGARLIVTDGVFSMKGSVADLPGIKALAERYDAKVMVDDAHGSGVLGENGRGTAEHYGMEGAIDLVCGTFSKTFASVGGFTAASRDVVTFLKLSSRPFIFTASPPPVVAATVLACLDVIRDEPGLLKRLHANSQRMREGLRDAGFRLEETITPIIPVLIGDDEKTFRMAGGLEEEGIIVNPVVPPAVPKEGTLIRVSLMATHTDDQVDAAVAKFTKVGRRLGIIGG